MPRYPSVRLGKPKDPENYEKLSVYGITVYYRESLADSFSTVAVKIERLLFVKFLVASGTRRG